MRRFFTKKMITGVLLITILFSFFFLNLKKSYASLEEIIKKYQWNSEMSLDTMNRFINEVDTSVNDQVFEEYTFVEAYGFMQLLMGKNEVNNFEIVKDKQGNLHYTYFANGGNDTTVLAERMVRLQKAADEKGARLMYLETPDKFIRGYTEFSTGIPYNYANETADAFLDKLKSHEIKVMDYRELIEEDGLDKSRLFYKTDHHWTIETTFWAFTKLVEELEDWGDITFPNKDLYTNIDNYNQITYREAHLGSMGRKLGKLYSGADDFTFIFPKFDTSFYFFAQNGEEQIRTDGRFEDSLTFKGLLSADNDVYQAEYDKYFTYLDGNPGFVEIHNFNETDGCKVLFIKDSMVVPMAAFLSTGCSKVYLVDPRYYGGDIEELVDDLDLDFIFVSFTPQNLTDEFFKFYEE